MILVTFLASRRLSGLIFQGLGETFALGSVIYGGFFVLWRLVCVNTSTITKPWQEHQKPDLRVAWISAGNPSHNSLQLLIPPLQRGGTCAAHGIEAKIAILAPKTRDVSPLEPS